MPQNATFNLGPYPFQISYIGKTGNEIILTSLSGDSLNNAPVARPDNRRGPEHRARDQGAGRATRATAMPTSTRSPWSRRHSTTTKGGTLNVNADGSFTYQPPTGFVGFDEFSYIISDGNDATDLATVTIEVQDVVPPTVTVNNPNGGEVIFVGTQTKLDWTITDKKPVSVSLFISRDLGNTYEKVATDIPNSGSYLWTVTPPGTNTGASPVFSALFRVEARDSSGNVSADVSDSPFALHDLATATTSVAVRGDGGRTTASSCAGSSPHRSSSRASRSNARSWRSGPWLEVSVGAAPEDGVTVAIDRTATADQSYVYRLVGTTSDDRRVVLGQLSGERHPTITEFAIGKVAPNPSRDAVRDRLRVAARGERPPERARRPGPRGGVAGGPDARRRALPGDLVGSYRAGRGSGGYLLRALPGARQAAHASRDPHALRPPTGSVGRNHEGFPGMSPGTLVIRRSLTAIRLC